MHDQVKQAEIKRNNFVLKRMSTVPCSTVYIFVIHTFVFVRKQAPESYRVEANKLETEPY